MHPFGHLLQQKGRGSRLLPVCQFTLCTSSIIKKMLTILDGQILNARILNRTLKSC